MQELEPMEWAISDINHQFLPFWEKSVGPEEGLMGVYIIWLDAPEPSASNALYVGQGNIRIRLQAHRNEPEFRPYRNRDVSVTWAYVGKTPLAGVECYFGKLLNPEIPRQFPPVTPIPAELPRACVLAHRI